MLAVAGFCAARRFPFRVAVIAISLLVLSACYNGPNLRDCSGWSTRSIPGCYRG
jgi:hypothetical protein